ncbi:hypothetical protein [Paracoccus amoyensis]|nr:hypothetical protein [Paracoccus amoyensis]
MLTPYLGSYAHPVGSKLAAIALFGISFGCLFWMAVNFHRMILLEETFAWIPRCHVREVLAYAVYSIPILIIFAVISFATILVIGQVLFKALIATNDITTAVISYYILSMVIHLLTATIGLRLFARLPALAIGTPVQSVFAAHKRSWLTLLEIALILMVAEFVYTFLATEIIGRFMTPLEPDTVLTSWPLLPFVFIFTIGLSSVAFGISLVTTLYGHYAKGMPLR